MKPTPNGQASNHCAKFRHGAPAHIPADTILGWAGLGQEAELEQEAELMELMGREGERYTGEEEAECKVDKQR